MSKWLDYFLKEEIRMANKHVKREFISVVIREMQIVARIRHHHIPTGVDKVNLKKEDNIKYWQVIELPEVSYTTRGSVKLYNSFVKLFDSCL